MTAQFPDIIEIDEQVHALFSNPLEQYFQAHPPRPELGAPCSACWRGYIARWRLMGGRLYLVEVCTDVSQIEMPQAGQPMASIMFACKNPPPGSWLPIDLSEPALAEWCSGQLRIPLGKMLYYEHAGYESVFESNRLISVERGAVVCDVIERLPEEQLRVYQEAAERARKASEEVDRYERHYEELRRLLEVSLESRWPSSCRMPKQVLFRIYGEDTLHGFIDNEFEEFDGLDALMGREHDLAALASGRASDLLESVFDDRHMTTSDLSVIQFFEHRLARSALEQGGHDLEYSEEFFNDACTVFETDLLALYGACREILFDNQCVPFDAEDPLQETTPRAPVAGETIALHLTTHHLLREDILDVQGAAPGYVWGFARIQKSFALVPATDIVRSTLLGRHQLPDIRTLDEARKVSRRDHEPDPEPVDTASPLSSAAARPEIWFGVILIAVMLFALYMRFNSP